MRWICSSGGALPEGPGDGKAGRAGRERDGGEETPMMGEEKESEGVLEVEPEASVM